MSKGGVRRGLRRARSRSGRSPAGAGRLCDVHQDGLAVPGAVPVLAGPRTAPSRQLHERSAISRDGQPHRAASARRLPPALPSVPCRPTFGPAGRRDRMSRSGEMTRRGRGPGYGQRQACSELIRSEHPIGSVLRAGAPAIRLPASARLEDERSDLSLIGGKHALDRPRTGAATRSIPVRALPRE